MFSKVALIQLSNYTKRSLGSSLYKSPGLVRFNQTAAAKASPVPPSPRPPPRRRNLRHQLFVSVGAAVVIYMGIDYYLEWRKECKVGLDIDYTSPYIPGKIKPSKSIVREKNPGNIKLTLYQFASCPFCCKVRAYLDYFGYSYDIVEVNSIKRHELGWTSYRKVPILAIQLPSKEDPSKYQEDHIVQLHDSSAIISALETFRLGAKYFSMPEVAKYFEPVKLIDQNDKGKLVDDYSNKYFVMLLNDKITDGKSMSERHDERHWREWIDDSFIHVISPNIYRTFNESLESFRWFDHFGEWEKHFSNFERSTIIYLGAFVMYFVGIKLKTKHQLKGDVRESLYDMSREWTKNIPVNKKFRGGDLPDLSDLSLYGTMQAFAGCQAFADMLETNPKIKKWYDELRPLVENNKGQVFLATASPAVKWSSNSSKSSSSSSSSSSEKGKKRWMLF